MRRRLLALAVVLLLAAFPAIAAGPADALYLMTRFTGSSLAMDAYLFRKGQVARAPESDAESFDFVAAKAAAPDRTGSYRMQGDKLVVAWADGKTVESNYKQDNACFGWNGGIFCPVKPFEKGAKLDGKFSGGQSAGGGAVASSTTISFAPDGTYALSSTGSVAPGGRVSGSAASSSSETGRYELSGTSLTLRSAGGAPKKVLVFPYDDGGKGPQPSRLYFGGTMLRRAG